MKHTVHITNDYEEIICPHKGYRIPTQHIFTKLCISKQSRNDVVEPCSHECCATT